MALFKIETAKAPAAIGPYSQGIRSEPGQKFVVVARQKARIKGSIKEQTKSIFGAIQSKLEQEGSTLEHIVRVEVFLRHIKKDFAEMNEEYGKWVSVPARQTVQADDLAEGADVEIACLAISEQAGDSQSGEIFVSGQLPIDPTTGKLVEGDIKAQTAQVLDNLEAVLQAAGGSLYTIVKMDVFLKNSARDLAKVRKTYMKRFTNPNDALVFTPIHVTELPLGVPVEISCIARQESVK